MKPVLHFIVLTAAACGGMAAQTIAGDAARGGQLLRDRGCLGCHTLNGQGGHSAPDLGRRIARNYTPGFLAGVLWNHAPSIWAEDGGETVFSENDAADLFAYFSSQNYFERLGDAARGKRVFAARHCAACHGIAKPVLAGANPVVAWRSLDDPIALAQAMWNRPQLMVRAFEREGIHCPPLTSQELTDLLRYIENLPDTRGKQPRFYLVSPRTGQRIFQAEGCAACHRGKLGLENRVSRLTAAGIAAAMWNHAPGTAADHPTLSYEEMSGIVGYLWSIGGRGDARRGRRLFATKRCIGCHDDAAAPGAEDPAPRVASGREPAAVAIVAAVWARGPAMQAEMGKKGLRWPRFDGSEMADVGAYLTRK